MTETNPTPTPPPEPDLTDHAYDGIREYDNPIPGWWNWIFIGTIAFAALYFFVATLANGQLSPIAFFERYKLAEMKAGGALKADAATLIRLSKDDDSLKAGAAIFAANCVACHGRDGSGVSGPNLTDDKYIYVTKITDIVDVVTNGRNNGAMPVWRNKLSPNEVIQVSAYVASLRCKNKPGRAPEANAQVIPPWSE